MYNVIELGIVKEDIFPGITLARNLQRSSGLPVFMCGDRVFIGDQPAENFKTSEFYVSQDVSSEILEELGFIRYGMADSIWGDPNVSITWKHKRLPVLIELVRNVTIKHKTTTAIRDFPIVCNSCERRRIYEFAHALLTMC